MKSNRLQVLFPLAVSTMILLPLSGCTSSSTDCQPDAQGRVPQSCSSGGSSGGTYYRSGGSSGNSNRTGVTNRSSGRSGFGSFGGGRAGG